VIDKIEVYICHKEVVTGEAVGGQVIGEHGCTVIRGVKTEKVMSDADRTALEVVKEFAGEKWLSVEVYDTSTFKGRLKAGAKRIRTTPTIVIGEAKIEGEHSPELLRSKLASYCSV
jgi:hypothetical protein